MSTLPKLLIVSDLHLGRGYYEPQTCCQHGGRISDLEDFFCDNAFFDFVAYHIKPGEEWHLVLNGDVTDFLQVIDFPDDEETLALLRERVLPESQDWAAWVAQKRKFGLGTTAIETSWKLKQIAAGHRVFFLALAYALAAGSRVVIVSGNHDIEWHWPLVKSTLRNLLREAYDPEQIERLSGRPAPAWHDEALERLLFCPRFYYVKGLAYIEHGCQYEPSNSFSNMFDPVLAGDAELPLDQQQIDLPMGSFFITYFFNLVEKVSPFADNVKPILRFIKWALFHQTGWVIKTLFTRWEVITMIAKRMRQIRREWAANRERSITGRPLLIPDTIPGAEGMSDVRSFIAALIEIENAEFKSNPPILYLGFVQMLKAAFNFKRDLLFKVAQKVHRILREHGDGVRYIAFGHDHDADIRPLEDGGMYLNTGTWVPIQGQEERFFRDTCELTYAKIVPGASPEVELLHWCDGPRRGERVILMTELPQKPNRRLWAWALAGVAAVLAGCWWQKYNRRRRERRDR